ncbi:MAG: ATP-dependent metallopeptidase FtsH/Yme1/Tma family protein, partial [Rhizobiaceae bacterium]|nr:ATP-dependent metallopeptidase FtsH/Yme1/Tma family protein [Rhizobiaceae bacterium]
MGNHSTPPQNSGPTPFNRWIVPLFVFFSFALFFSVFNLSSQNTAQTVSYSEIKDRIRSGQVQQVLLSEHEINAELRSEKPTEKTRLRAVVPVQGQAELLLLLEQHKVEITAEAPSGNSMIAYLLPWIVILGFYYWMSRKMSSGMGGAGGMPGGLKDLVGGRFTKPSKQSKRITFDDVAGQDNAKREVSELVEFLRDPERFEKLGAEVPHGVLLMGPPGTGKTLLARALAGEADVPFFSTSGSEFIEVFVGVGAGRVRRMFEAARKQAPSIIFIDELDSIGRTRGTGLGGGHDEREQTLNQILAELD